MNTIVNEQNRFDVSSYKLQVLHSEPYKLSVIQLEGEVEVASYQIDSTMIGLQIDTSTSEFVIGTADFNTPTRNIRLKGTENSFITLQLAGVGIEDYRDNSFKHVFLLDKEPIAIQYVPITETEPGGITFTMRNPEWYQAEFVPGQQS